jgi:hypothetical protein
MPQDKTPEGDAMTHRFPDQKIPEARAHDIPPDNLPPGGDRKRDDDGDGKPKAPPADDEPGRRYVPIDLPGKPHAPERVDD